jgi:hypothetical protein
MCRTIWSMIPRLGAAPCASPLPVGWPNASSLAWSGTIVFPKSDLPRGVSFAVASFSKLAGGGGSNRRPQAQDALPGCVRRHGSDRSAAVRECSTYGVVPDG